MDTHDDAPERAKRVRDYCLRIGLSTTRAAAFESKVRCGILNEDAACRLANALRDGVDTSIGSPFWYRERLGCERPAGAVSFREMRQRAATVYVSRRRTPPPNKGMPRRVPGPVNHQREIHSRPAKANAPPADEPPLEPQATGRPRVKRDLAVRVCCDALTYGMYSRRRLCDLMAAHGVTDPSTQKRAIRCLVKLGAIRHEIDGRVGYSWPGEPLRSGEFRTWPAPWWSDEEHALRHAARVRSEIRCPAVAA